MIIHFTRENTWRYEYLICPAGPQNVMEFRDIMLRRAKVIEGSYAYRLIDDLHAAIFLRSLDLKADYDAYFAREYDSFHAYLRRFLCFPSDVVAALTRVEDISVAIYHFHPAYDFLSDPYGFEFLTRLLEDPQVEEAK